MKLAGTVDRLLLALLAVHCAPLAGAVEAQEIARDPFYEVLAASDEPLARALLQEALETRLSNDSSQWRSAATGDSGSVMPLRTFRIETGFYCRDYREVVVTGGRLRERLGTACRSVEGVWIPVER